MRDFLLTYLDAWRVVLGWTWVGTYVGGFIYIIVWLSAKVTDNIREAVLAERNADTMFWSFVFMTIIFSSLAAKAWWLHKNLWFDLDERFEVRSRRRKDEFDEEII